jgi:hypothetical protein
MKPFRYHLFICTQQKPTGVLSCHADIMEFRQGFMI